MRKKILITSLMFGLYSDISVSNELPIYTANSHMILSSRKDEEDIPEEGSFLDILHNTLVCLIT